MKIFKPIPVEVEIGKAKWTRALPSFGQIRERSGMDHDCNGCGQEIVGHAVGGFYPDFTEMGNLVFCTKCAEQDDELLSQLVKKIPDFVPSFVVEAPNDRQN